MSSSADFKSSYIKSRHLTITVLTLKCQALFLVKSVFLENVHIGVILVGVS